MIKVTTALTCFQKSACINQLKLNHNFFFHIIITPRFGETQKAKEQLYAAKTTINIWDVNVDNIAISKLVKTKTNSEYLIGYLDKVLKASALIIPKVSEYVKIFKVKDEDNDKSNKFMSFRINNESYLKNIKLFGLILKTLKLFN